MNSGPHGLIFIMLCMVLVFYQLKVGGANVPLHWRLMFPDIPLLSAKLLLILNEITAIEMIL